MCLHCGDDGAENKRHGDPRNITWTDLKGAAKASGSDPMTVAENILGATARKVEKGTNVGCRVVKASDERRYTLGVAYGANLPDVGVAADGFRDFAGPQAVEDAAWNYLRKGGGVGINHLDGTEGHGTVVESYVYRGPDWPVTAPDGSTQVIKAGDWLLGVVWDPPTWSAIKAGEINGYSPQGSARRRRPTAEALAQLRRS